MALSLGHLLHTSIIIKVAKLATKPMILVKICYELLYVIQGIKNIFTSCSQLISKYLVAPIPAASDWSRTLFISFV